MLESIVLIIVSGSFLGFIFMMTLLQIKDDKEQDSRIQRYTDWAMHVAQSYKEKWKEQGY